MKPGEVKARLAHIRASPVCTKIADDTQVTDSLDNGKMPHLSAKQKVSYFLTMDNLLIKLLPNQRLRKAVNILLNCMKLHHFFPLLFVLSTSVVSGVTVNFDDATRTPSDSLLIGGITVTTYNSQLVATVAGSGLGVNGGVGPIDQVNFQEIWQAGNSGITGNNEAGLSFAVNGIINSVTFTPYLSIYSADGTLLPDQFDFYILAAFGVENYALVNPAGLGPITVINPGVQQISPANNLEFRIDGIDTQTDIANYRYLQGYVNETQTFQFGITVQSLDYTPTVTPEPATVALAGLGLAALLMFRRKSA